MDRRKEKNGQEKKDERKRIKWKGEKKIKEIGENGQEKKDEINR